MQFEYKKARFARLKTKLIQRQENELRCFMFGLLSILLRDKFDKFAFKLSFINLRNPTQKLINQNKYHLKANTSQFKEI